MGGGPGWGRDFFGKFITSWIILIKEEALNIGMRRRPEEDQKEKVAEGWRGMKHGEEGGRDDYLDNVKLRLKADPLYTNFKHDVTPEGLALAFRWVPEATGLSEVEREMLMLKAREDLEAIWPEARDEREAMALFQERTRTIQDPEKLKVYLCEFLRGLAILASAWVEGRERAGMNASAQRMYG